MASVVFGGGITNMVGSHAGNTFARNKGGAYMKKKTHGTNPRSANQMRHRTVAGRLSKYYSFTLSDADRSAWATFAATNPVINRLGNTAFLSAQQMFVKVNSNLLFFTNTVNAAPPPSTAISTPSNILCSVIDSSIPQLDVQVVAVSPGLNDAAVVWVSPQMNPGRSFISSQLRRLTSTQAPNVNVNVTTLYEQLFGTIRIAPGTRLFVRAMMLNTLTGVTSSFFQKSFIWT